MDDAHGFQEFMKKCWDNVWEMFVQFPTASLKQYLQVMKQGPQHLKVSLKSVFHQTGRPKILGVQWRHPVINGSRIFQNKEPLVCCSGMMILSYGCGQILWFLDNVHHTSIFWSCKDIVSTHFNSDSHQPHVCGVQGSGFCHPAPN
jgi:hypothetical protein